MRHGEAELTEGWQKDSPLAAGTRTTSKIFEQFQP